MTVKWEEVRVFISSTFADMHAERDYLVKRVFPDLREWCEQRKLRLIDIDLRWGITVADASSKRAVGICLEHVNDCRPFFLCFLGQRQGWELTEDNIASETFERFPELKGALHPGSSTTELEIRHAVLHPFSFVDPEHSDRLIHYTPASQAFFYIRDPGFLNALNDAPRQLLCSYTDDVGPEDETKKERQAREGRRDALKNLRRDISGHKAPGSLTHRPITYVTSWRRELTTPELAMSVECPFHDDAGRRRWQSTWNRFAHLGLSEADVRVPAEKQPLAQSHNAGLTRGRLSQFRSLERARGQFPSNTELARIIQHDFQQAILARYPDRKLPPETSDLQREIDQHEEFISNSVQGFIERGFDFVELDDYVKSNSNRVFVLTAAGGMGKSTLLAKWVDRYRMQIEGSTEQSIHFRFVGQSDLSTTVANLLHYLLRELQEIAHKIPSTVTKITQGLGEQTQKVEVPLEIPLDPVKLRQAWAEWLSTIGKRGKTIILIDALDQLESGLSDLDWIPQRLPKQIKMIVSLKRVDQKSDEVLRQFREAGQARLSELKPFEEEADRRRLVHAHLSQYLKELDEQHRETLIHLPGASNPLYLKVLLSELRVFGSFGDLAAKISEDFGDTPVSAFVGVLNRLKNDPAYSPIDPKLAVPLLFGLLAHARHGLSVEELISLLVQALGAEDLRTSREDAADTINLFLRQIRRFMARREGRYDFFFDSFKIAAQQCYVAQNSREPNKRSAKEWHQILAGYFYALSNWQGTIEAESADTARRQPRRRKLAELPHHLTQAEEWDKLEETLCDLSFIEAKVVAGLVYELQADYEAALDALPERKEERQLERARDERVARYTKELIDYAKASSDARSRQTPVSFGMKIKAILKKDLIPFPEPISSIRLRTDEELKADSQRLTKRPTRLDRILPFSTFVASEIHTISEFSNMPGFCLQQAHNYADSGPVVAAAEQILDTGFKERLILENRRQRPAYSARRALVRTLEGHTGSVWSVSMTTNGKIAVSGGDDGVVRIWDLTTGQCMRKLIGHEGAVLSVSMTPEGKTIVSGGQTRTGEHDGEGIRVWDLNTGRKLRGLHKCWHYAIGKLTADGKVVVSGDSEGTLYVWDAETGKCLHTLKGHASSIMCISVTPDAKIAVSGSRDNTLCVWDLVKGRCLRKLVGHEEWVSGVNVTPNGKLCVSGSNDTTLRIWDLVSGRCLRTLEGHELSVLGVRLVPDGKLILSASADRTLRVWDANTGKCLRTLRGHGNKVECVCVTPDGKTALSGSKDGTLRLWELDADQRMPSFEGHRVSVNSISLTPDGKTGISASGDKTLRVWDVAKGKTLGTLEGHEWGVLCVSTAPNGKLAISGSEDNTLRVWRLDTGACLHTLRGHSEAVWGLSVAADGRTAVSGSVDETLRVWDLATGRCLQVFDGHGIATGFVSANPYFTSAPWPDSIQGVGLTPDGRVAISTHYDATLRVWDLTSGEYLNILRGHRGGLRCVSIAPNGRTVISVGDDSTLRVWDLNTGQLLSNLETGIDTSVRSLSLSPDGSVAFADSGYRILQAWNLETKECIAIFPMTEGGIKLSELRTESVIGIGAYSGEVVFAGLHNFKFAIPFTTAVRLWSPSQRGTGGRWDKRITALCEHCGRRFEPTPVVLDAIGNISAHLTQNRSPCLELPAEAWTEPRLLAECPHCRLPVRFNPFVVDNRDQL